MEIFSYARKTRISISTKASKVTLEILMATYLWLREIQMERFQHQIFYQKPARIQSEIQVLDQVDTVISVLNLKQSVIGLYPRKVLGWKAIVFTTLVLMAAFGLLVFSQLGTHLRVF